MDGTVIAYIDSPTFRVLPIWKEERRPTAPGIPAGPKVLVPQSPFHKRLKRNEAASFIHNQRALSHAASLDDLRRNNPPQGGMNHPGDSGMLVRSLQMSIPSPSKPIAYGESSPSLYPPSSNSWNNVASGYASNSGPASYFNPPHPFNMSQPMLNLMQPFQQQFAAVSSSLPQGSHALYPSYFNNLSGQPPLPGQIMSASPSSPRYQHPVPINAAGQGYLSANLDDNHNQVANRLSRFQQSLISLPHPNFHFNHTINSRGPFVSGQDGKFLLPNPNVLKDSKNMDGM